ncbi:Dynein light domain containing protein, partial [Asbolus verrucosus]
MTDSKVVIKKLEMSEDMQQDAVDCATQAIEKHIIEKVSAAQRDGHVTDVPDH